MITTSDAQSREEILLQLEQLEEAAYREKHPGTAVNGEKMSSWETLKSRFRRGGIPEVVRLSAEVIRKQTGRGKKSAPKSLQCCDSPFRMDRGNTLERADLYFSRERIAVYSALFGSYDWIEEPRFQPDNVDYYLITDQEIAPDSKWLWIDPKSVVPAEYAKDPVKSNRWCKMHPNLLFPDYTASVYVDSNVQIMSDLTPLTAALEQYPVAMFLHKGRNCVYQEIEACRIQNKASEEAMKKQVERTRSLGLPEGWGLLEAPVIARRHMDPECVGIMEAWWEEFLSSPSRRDQIALMGCLWKLQIPVARIGTLGSDYRYCDLFVKEEHRKKI